MISNRHSAYFHLQDNKYSHAADALQLITEEKFHLEQLEVSTHFLATGVLQVAWNNGTHLGAEFGKRLPEIIGSLITGPVVPISAKRADGHIFGRVEGPADFTEEVKTEETIRQSFRLRHTYDSIRAKTDFTNMISHKGFDTDGLNLKIIIQTATSYLTVAWNKNHEQAEELAQQLGTILKSELALPAEKTSFQDKVQTVRAQSDLTVRF